MPCITLCWWLTVAGKSTRLTAPSSLQGARWGAVAAAGGGYRPQPWVPRRSGGSAPVHDVAHDDDGRQDDEPHNRLERLPPAACGGIRSALAVTLHELRQTAGGSDAAAGRRGRRGGQERGVPEHARHRGGRNQLRRGGDHHKGGLHKRRREAGQGRDVDGHGDAVEDAVHRRVAAAAGERVRHVGRDLSRCGGAIQRRRPAHHEVVDGEVAHARRVVSHPGARALQVLRRAAPQRPQAFGVATMASRC